MLSYIDHRGSGILYSSDGSSAINYANQLQVDGYHVLYCRVLDGSRPSLQWYQAHFINILWWSKVSIPKNILRMSKLIVIIDNCNNQAHWDIDLMYELTRNVRENIYKVIVMNS